MAVSATITDQWDDGQRYHITGILTFSGSYTTGGDTLDLGAAGSESRGIPGVFIAVGRDAYNFKYIAGADAQTGLLKVVANATNEAELAAGAYPVDLSGLTDVQYYAVLPKLQ